MPSKVRFQTEYNSSFKAPAIEVLKAARSPILKPRPAFEIIEGGGKPQFEAGFGVPVRGPDAHASREPALHHKKILKNVTNPNLEEEIGKASAKTRENDGKNAVDTQNPILKYAEDINKAKAIETLPSSTQARETQTDKTAGKESDNLRYLVLEPPMQRKRRSPFEFNHNLLRTDTIEYPESKIVEENASYNDGLSKQSKQTVEENTRKKLSFETVAPKTKSVDKILPVSGTESMKRQEIEAKSQAGGKEEDDDDFSRRRKKRLSPAKEQRRKDLKEVMKKQNERVERALKIKAGMQTIEPPLFSHPVTTEYRKEFAWKEPLKRELRHVIPVSDISKDGEQSSDPNEKASKLKSFKTEYQLQFKEYPLSREPPNIAKISSNLKENHKEKTFPEKRSLHHSRNVQPIFFPHGTQSSSQSEYKANFVAPSNLKLKMKAWQESRKSSKGEDQSGEGSEWFKEVLRLREKAQSYRERSRETHYPTVFLASLDDDCSCSSDGDSGGDGKEQQYSIAPSSKSYGNGKKSESAMATKEKHRDVGKEENGVVTKAGRCSQRQAKEEYLSNGTVAWKGAESSKDGNETRQRGNEAQKEDEETQTTFEPESIARMSSPASSSDTDDSCMNMLKGRLDTARVKSTSDHRRHNLDRTTPARGGASAAPSARVSSEVTAPVHEFRSLGTDMSRQRISGERQRQQKGNGPPKHSSEFIAAGRGNVVRETVPREAQKTYQFDKYEDKENDGDLFLTDLEENEAIKPQVNQAGNHLLRTLAPPRAFVQPSKQERSHHEERKVDDNSDGWSDTSMSARDSVISEVFERSRKRRDEFW